MKRLLAIIGALKQVDPIFVDGGLYVGMAIFTALSGFFSTDEAAKYLEPVYLFWLRGFCTTNGAWMLALKMFRSSHYSEYRKNKELNGNATPGGIASNPPPV